jgi:hypothetical protein
MKRLERQLDKLQQQTQRHDKKERSNDSGGGDDNNKTRCYRVPLFSKGKMSFSSCFT